MILASAQTMPKRGDVQYNLDEHYLLCDKAVQSGAQFIVFPELSISGYEREDAHRYIFTPEDNRLQNLKNIALSGQITIVAGAPVNIKDHLYIGSFIFLPNGKTLIYTKQYLHTSEDKYFEPSFNFNPTVTIDSMQFSFAICADLENGQHIKNAQKAKSQFYVPSIFYTPGSIRNLHDKLSRYAKEYNMHVLMSNFAGKPFGTQSGGRSAFWDCQGKLIAASDGENTSLVIVDNHNGEWKGMVSYLN